MGSGTNLKINSQSLLSNFRVSPWGVPSLDCLRKRFDRFYRFKRFKGVGAAHFVILSGEKRRMLKNGLSENMRTESKDLSAAEYRW